MRSFPLLEAAASLAQDEYPELDVQQVLGDVDQLLARLKRRLPADAAPLQRLRALNQFFFHDLSFGGNVNDYYDPDNSYLNAVLRTRRGIPISLAVLWMELAQGLGLQARGVGFPGPFHAQGHPAQGAGGDRSLHRQVAFARGTQRAARALQAQQRPGRRLRRAAGPLPAAGDAARNHRDACCAT